MIRLGTTDLILQDLTGNVERALSGWLPSAFSDLFPTPPGVHVGRGRNLLFRDDPRPCPRIGELIIPTGATRWTIGFFLATETQATAVETQTASEGRLLLQLGSNRIFSPDDIVDLQPVVRMPVWALAARPITVPFHSPELTAVDRLWVIPVVDERFWWQFRPASEDDLLSDISLSSDWSVVLAHLEARLRSEITPSVHPRYTETPDILEDNDYESAAQILDTLAEAFEAVVVPDLSVNSFDTAADPHYLILSTYDSLKIDENNQKGLLGIGRSLLGDTYATSSFPDFGENWAGSPAFLLGGYLSQTTRNKVPEFVHIILENEDYQVSYSDLPSGIVDGNSYRPGAVATLRLPYLSAPTVDTTEFYARIAEDFFRRALAQHEFSFSGMQRWQPTAFDCLLTYRQCVIDGKFNAITQVKSYGLNVIAEMNESDTGTSELRDAIVRDCLGGGWYRLEFAIRNDCAPEAASGSGSGASGSGATCDPCDEIESELCGDIAELSREAGTGTGEFIEAFDCQTIPLVIGGPAVVGKTRRTSVIDSSGSGSGSGSDNEDCQWRILRAKRETITIPHERWVCCDDGTEKLVESWCYFVEGVKCFEFTDECDTASGSG